MSKKLVRILSISGGGVRTLMAVRFLCEIEKRLQQKQNDPNLHIVDYFEFFSGTSGGSLAISLFLKRDDYGECCYSSQGVYERMKAIFQSKTFVDSTKEEFGNRSLKDLNKAFLIPAYEPEKKWLAFFTSYLCEDPAHNFYLSDVVNASGVLPVFFEPVKCRSLSDGVLRYASFLNVPGMTEELYDLIKAILHTLGLIDSGGRVMQFERNTLYEKLHFPAELQAYTRQIVQTLDRIVNPEFTFVDGCMFANNTSLCALMEVGKLDFPDRGISNPTLKDTFLLSLGAGDFFKDSTYNTELDTAFQSQMQQILFECPETLTDFQTQYFYDMFDIHHHYQRLHPVITKQEGYPSDHVIDFSDRNIDALIRNAEEYIQKYTDRFDLIVDQLID